MGAKSKRRSKRRSSVHWTDQVKRNLERGDFKKALKDARVAHRQNPTAQSRSFLEHACIGRAQQLAQHGLIEDSRRIIGELLDLGVTEPSVEGGLPELLLAVGMLDRLPRGQNSLTDEQQQRLRVRAADQAVLRPEATPGSMPELGDGARTIRAALQAVELGDESAAVVCLKTIPRHSPFADWRYFVRGLTAYYRRDTSGMQANWDRLAPDRAAAKIAAPLRVMAGLTPPQDDLGLRSKIIRLEQVVSSRTVLGHLLRLQGLVVHGEWPQVFRLLRGIRGPLRQRDDDLYLRLVSCLSGTLTCDGLLEELESLSRTVDAPPHDPYWNRAKAVACEQSDLVDESGAEHYWRKYLADLKTLKTLSPSQRAVARGLVWLRLAKFSAGTAESLRRCPCGADHEPEIREAEQEARHRFDRCHTLAPTYVPGHTTAAEFHLAGDRPEEAARVYQRLLEYVPDHLEALLFLGRHFVTHGDALQARQYAERARELKPLDKQIEVLLWSTHVAAASDFARQCDCDAARAALTAADRLQPARRGDYDMLARKAVLEIKAGDAGASRRLVEQAQEELDEPTALWLVMTIEAIRYDLPKEDVWLYEERWIKALKRRCRSRTAGLMCRMLDAHLKMPQAYPQQDEHARHLVKYITRCSRVRWQMEDLRSACEFLEHSGEKKLLLKFAKQGMRKFPEVGCFHFLMGMFEMDKGPYRFDRELTVQRLREAIELASKSTDPRDDVMVQAAKRALNVAQGSLGDLDDDECDDEYDDEYDDTYMGGKGPGESADVSPRDLLNALRAACKRAGVDPEDVLEEIGGIPPGAGPRGRTKE